MAKNCNVQQELKNVQKQQPPLDPPTAQKLFENRETWCAVKMKEEDWYRKKRKTFKRHLESHLFEDQDPDISKPRCTFQVDEPSHKQARHFPAKHLISQWTVL